MSASRALLLLSGQQQATVKRALTPDAKDKAVLITIGVYILFILICWCLPVIKLILYPFKVSCSV